MSDNPPEITGVVVDAEDNPVEEVRVYFVEDRSPYPISPPLPIATAVLRSPLRPQELTS